jgi:hypothetical protein
MRKNSVTSRLARFCLFVGVAFTLLLSAALTPPQNTTAQTSTRYKFSVKNNSNCSVYELYIGQSYKDSWGKNYLKGNLISPGETYTLSVVPGEYDIKFVSKTGKECIYMKFKVFDDKTWSLTNEWLNRCAGWKCGK